MAAPNQSLNTAQAEKNDEFYTRYEDIAAEVEHYKHHFKGKVVACNCDDPRWSNFSKFFKDHFEELELRGLISLFKGSDAYVETVGSKEGSRLYKLAGDGDFRNEETQEYLAQADIVVTNPPFSLFRDYVEQLLNLEKKFLVIASENAISYERFFPFLRDEKVWLGCTKPKVFRRPDGSQQTFGNICWYTNMDMARRHKPLEMVESYSPEMHPSYSNIDAIEVGRVKLMPKDWDGMMGVPVSYLAKHCPDQFEIVGNDTALASNNDRGVVHGKRKYARIIIRRRT